VFVEGYMSCLQEDTCLVCRRVHVLFVGGYMSCLLEGTYLFSSYKYDIYHPTNKTCTLLQTRHVPSYKHDMYPPTNTTCTLLQTRHREHVLFALLYPRSPKGEGVYCFTSVRPSFRPSKVFFVAYLSVTIDGRNLIFGHKHHIGIPYCG
jgi:hypothetical protein